MPTLFIVGTPIGNLEDLTPRAARILSEVALVAAEDTRVTRRLLNHLNIRTRTTSFHQHNWRGKLDEVLAALAEGDVALATDAGMPGVSDPGSELVSAASSAGFKVEVVPGPSAVTAALALSGFVGDAFSFLGFLPRRKKDRQSSLREVLYSAVPLVIFEAPHRLRATLTDLELIFGDRQLAVCREITKRHEEVFRGTASEGLEHFDLPRGEVVIVIQGRVIDSTLLSDTESADAQANQEKEIRQRLIRLKQDGIRAKEAVASVAEYSGLPNNRVYRIWVELGRDFN